VIGILGVDPFDGSLDAVTAGETVHGPRTTSPRPPIPRDRRGPRLSHFVHSYDGDAATRADPRAPRGAQHPHGRRS
jgi:hypothetical protein